MTKTSELAGYLDTLLEAASVPDYPGAINGLQFDNRGEVAKIAASVDFSIGSIYPRDRGESESPARSPWNVLGWSQPITGNAVHVAPNAHRQRHCSLRSHLPLDRHATFGNNVLLSHELGLVPSGEFARYKGTAVGVTGEASVATADIVAKAKQFAHRHHGDVVATSYSQDRKTNRWAICTGAGASAETLQEVTEAGIDTLIVGEGPHWTAVEAEELGIVIIYAGHYATETLGVRALSEHLAAHFQLDWVPLHAPTGL